MRDMSIDNFAVFPNGRHLLCGASLTNVDGIAFSNYETGDYRMIGT